MKKFLIAFLVLLCIATPTFAATTLYQKNTENKISTGTTLKNYKIFTDKGWLNVNVLLVDLDDDYTKIDLITSSNGCGTTQNLKTMATNANVIAAVNGDFFSANSSRGNSVGFAYSNGKIFSSSYYENELKDVFASFMLDDNNSPFYAYLTNYITLKSIKTRKEITISNINKYSSNYNMPSIYTSDFGKNSPGANEDLPMVEIVFENNKVIEIRENEEGIEIPKDGFVVSAVGDGATFLKENFKKGYKATLITTYRPDIKNINFAISGGSKLITDGVISTTFTDGITGMHPRTAIGSSKDGKTIYLVTVDGRMASSIGMSEKDLAEFLKSINVYNAINLDGGGSTTMVAQRLGESSLSTINKPSGGSLRSIINGIGIFSSAPSSDTLKNLEIEIEDKNVFKGKKRIIKVQGYNKYYSPVEVDESKISWTYDGVPVTVENGILTGNIVGSTILTATIGRISANVEINILSDVNELSISPKKSTISSGENVTFEISAKNKNGYYSKLNNDEVTWKLESGDGTLNNNIFTANKSGDYIISVSDGNAKTYALVTVNGKTSKVIEDFEDVNYVFDPYPDEVIGSAEKSSKEFHTGNLSVKLSYDFNQDIKIRAAYIEFKNSGIDIPENTTDLSFWVYNEGPKQEKLKIKLKDSTGNYHLIVVQKGLTHTGWKEFSYSLSDISLPAKITDIYLAQDNIDVKSSGYIYVDDLTFYSKSTAINSTTKLPEDIKGVDNLNKETPLSDSNSFRIAVTDAILDSNLMIDNLRNKKMEHAINTSSDIAIFTTQKNDKLLSNITAEKIICNSYTGATYKNSTFITLNAQNGGIRNTESSQWIKIQEDIKKSTSDNIFIIMNTSLDNFNDNEEMRLFIDVLCELKREINKNIWVLHKGNYTTYSMERGIKYLGINNEDIDSHDAIDISKNNKFILITVNGKSLTYEIRRIFK